MRRGRRRRWRRRSSRVDKRRSRVPRAGRVGGAGEEEGGAEAGRVVEAGAQGVGLQEHEALQEGDPVEELRQDHLLLPGGVRHLGEQLPHPYAPHDSEDPLINPFITAIVEYQKYR